LASGAGTGGGTTLSNLLALERAVLGRRSSSGELESWTGGVLVGSNPNEEESEDMRERDGMSGERGGAKPVTQSITNTRWGRFASEVRDDTLPDLSWDVVFLVRSSKVVDAGRLRRSVRWMAEYV
jgi:hypothetical protein